MFGAEMNIQIISFYSCWGKKKEKKKKRENKKSNFLVVFWEPISIVFYMPNYSLQQPVGF